MKSYDAYLFDLDGTLVDTAPDLGGALNASLQNAGLPGVTEAQARMWIGHGAKFSLTQALDHHNLNLDPAAVEALLDNFLNHYEDHVAELSTPYAGVVDTLDALRRIGQQTCRCHQQAHALHAAPAIGTYLSMDIFSPWFAATRQPCPNRHPIRYCSV